MTQPLQYGYAGERTYAKYYRHSNRIRPAGMIVATGGGIIAAFLPAMLYAYIVLYNRYIYLYVISLLLFGIFLGAVPALIMRWGKVRSVPLALTITGLVTLAAYYIYWVTWVWAALKDAGITSVSFGGLLVSPRRLAAAALAINDLGTGGISGAPLWGVWACEALCILGIALFVTAKMQRQLPYCERCDRWCLPGAVIRQFQLCKITTLKTEMENHNWAWLNTLHPKHPQSSAWLQVVHHRCGKCEKLHTLSFESAGLRARRSGETVVHTRTVLNKLLVDAADVEVVRGHQAAVEISRTASALAQMEPAPEEEANCYTSRHGEQFGPYTWSQLCTMATEKNIAADDDVLLGNATGWVKAHEIAELGIG